MRRRSSGKASTTASICLPPSTRGSSASASRSNRPASTRRWPADDAEKIANALLALIYTPALGDPEGPALLGGDIAQRHNFGLVGPAGMRRDFVAWALPREQVGDGSPWHVEGSILGLDIALARLALRRIADNEMPVAPTINLNDQLTFARTVMTLNPRELRDADRDRLVAAIARGRERVAAAGANLAAVLALAAEAQLPHVGAADPAVDDHAHARRRAGAVWPARSDVARQARPAATHARSLGRLCREPRQPPAGRPCRRRRRGRTSAAAPTAG